MKQFYIRTLLTLLLSIQSFYFSKAQTIHQGDVNLATQAEVDSFGLEGYTHIAGHLRIGNIDITNPGNPSNITNLNALIGITSVDSLLLINDNPLLFSLNGLDSLSFVGKSLQLRFNTGLQSLQGLNNLTQTKLLLINWCHALVDLEGLNSLEGDSTSRITLAQNNLLNTLDGLDNLTTLQGIYISSNDNLESLSGLEHLTSIRYYFSLYGNENLTTLDGLQNIESISRFNIVDNEELSDYCAISNIYNNGYLNQFDVANFNISNNSYNPSFSDIVNNHCNIAPISINEQSGLSSTTLSPNPTTGLLHLDFGTAKKHTIHITNMAGHVISKPVKTSELTYTFNLDVPKGVYFVEVISDLDKQQFKVIKQ